MREWNDKNTMFLGIGNGGCKIIEVMRNVNNQTYLIEAHYVFADCDIEDLDSHTKDKDCRHILLDKKVNEFPIDVFDGVEQLTIVAGLTGFTGSEYSIRAVEGARKAGVTTIDFVGIIGFLFEGHGTIMNAIKSMKAIIQTPGVGWMNFNNETIVEEQEHKILQEALSSFNYKLVNYIVNSKKMYRRDWNERTVLGEECDLDFFVDCMAKGKINRYDILQTLRPFGYNLVGVAECKEFSEGLKHALRDIPLDKVDDLLICCDERALGVCDFHEIYKLSGKAFSKDFKVKLVNTKDDNLTDTFNVLVVATCKDPGFRIYRYESRM